jgi:hypothetical protein
LYDDSGVAHVVGVFAHTKPGRFSHRDPASRYEDIWLHGEGQGKIKAEVAITGKVDERTATGEYVCRYVQAHDTQGNYMMFRPDPEIRFRVDNDPYDREGPELGGGALRTPTRRAAHGGLASSVDKAPGKRCSVLCILPAALSVW